MADDIKLPEPAFRLKWTGSAYKVDKPDIGDTDVYTADQLRAAVEAERARRVPTAPDNSEYKRGWDECMAVWADHMRRMNAALNTPLPPGWANHASHILQNVREALDAAHGIPAPKGGE